MMTIISDTRQQAGKHTLKEEYFERNGIKVIRSKLPVGDYANIKDLSVVVDTKANIQEVISTSGSLLNATWRQKAAYSSLFL